MADYQDEFKRILDEEVSDYAARALGLLSGVRAGAVAMNTKADTPWLVYLLLLKLGTAD